MASGILMIVFGLILALSSGFSGSNAADNGNIASVLWNLPLFIIGISAFSKGLNLVGMG